MLSVVKFVSCNYQTLGPPGMGAGSEEPDPWPELEAQSVIN